MLGLWHRARVSKEKAKGKMQKCGVGSVQNVESFSPLQFSPSLRTTSRNSVSGTVAKLGELL